MGFIRKGRWREGLQGQSVEGGDYFKYFRQRGTIIRGRRLIKGRLLGELTAIIPARKYGNPQWTVARKNLNEL